MSELASTKERIFDAFVEMASAVGYENVTTRDIAKRISINAASIYYHFESKEKILEYAYDYYAMYQYDNRNPIEDMKRLVETGDAAEIISSMFYTFETDDVKKYTRMILITKIIYMRLFQDPIANAMFAESHANNSEYVKDVLQHGIAIGRVDPAFDVETFTDVLIGSKIVMGIEAFASADYQVGQLDQEQRILALLVRLFSTAMI
jgi:AcrR family transcriptional regulator